MTRGRARCEVCGDVLESRHPWDVQVCSCGRLTVSGGPNRRRVQWHAEPGAGWTDVPDEEHLSQADLPEEADLPEDAGPDGQESRDPGAHEAG